MIILSLKIIGHEMLRKKICKGAENVIINDEKNLNIFLGSIIPEDFNQIIEFINDKEENYFSMTCHDIL